MNKDRYQQLKNYLTAHEWARERRNRHDFILNILDYHFPITQDMTKDFVNDYNTAVRYIQMIEKECPELRGKDYDQGKAIVQDHVLKLGYEVGYRQDIKQSKLL